MARIIPVRTPISFPHPNIMAGTGTADIPSGTFDYYIGPSGSDSNDGLTTGTPWAITAINTKRATYAGKTVGLLDGTYYCNALAAGNDYTRPALQVAEGDATHQTVIKAVHPRLAIINGRASSGAGAIPATDCMAIGQGSGGDSLANNGYFTLDGLVIEGWYSTGCGTWLSSGVQGVVVKNCIIRDIRNPSTGIGNNCAGVRSTGTTGMLVQNCQIHDCFGGNSTESEGYGIMTFQIVDMIIEYCTIYNCTHGIYHKQSNNHGHTSRYNFIECNDTRTYAGIQESTGGGSSDIVLFHNNIVVADIPWDGTSFAAPPIMQKSVYFNTFYWNGSFDSAGVFLPGSNTAKLDFYGNIISRTGGSVGFLGDLGTCTGDPDVCDYNCFPASPALTHGPYGSPGSAKTLAQYRTATGKEASSIAATPSFVSPTSLNPQGFQLQVGSPCIGTAKSNGTSGGSACDMGAWGGPSPPSRIGCDF